MPLVLPVLAVALLAALSAYLLYVLLQRINVWLSGILETVFTPHPSFWRRVLTYPLKLVSHGVQLVYHAVAVRLSHGVAYLSHQASRVVHAFALVENGVADAIGSVATEMLRALNALRDVTIPKLIDNALAPVRTIAVQGRAIARAARADLDLAESRVGIILSDLPWGAGAGFAGAMQGTVGALRHVWDDFYDNVKPRVQFIDKIWLPSIQDYISTIYNDLYMTGRDSLAGIRASLGVIERDLTFLRTDPLAWVLALLGSAAGVIGLTAILTKVAPHLFCRNTTNVAKRLCNMDESLINALLAGALLELVVLDPRALAHAAQDVERGLEHIVRQTAGI